MIDEYNVPNFRPLSKNFEVTFSYSPKQSHFKPRNY